MYDLETDIEAWRERLAGKGGIDSDEIAELESHLRDEIDDLIRKGLKPDEAFLISIGRIGNADEVSREFARTRREQLWKQLMVSPVDGNLRHREIARNELIWVITLALVAGTLGKIPALFGIGVSEGEMIYLKNAAIFIIPSVVIYFRLRHGTPFSVLAVVLAVFAGCALAVNIYPFAEEGQTVFLTSLHLPLFVWLVAGIAYLSNHRRSSRRRMDFLRLSGEAFIYAVLIGCGGVVLVGFTMELFSSIGIDAGPFVEEFLVIYGIFAIPVFAVFLAEIKSSIIENMAPVLAKIFTPLFLLVLIAFLGVMGITGTSPFAEREFLIGFDVMLGIVLALTIYIISARQANEPPQVYDYITFALVITAMLCDITALSAIIFRISSYGMTPNKMAALGENILLLGNLAGIAILYARFFLRKGFFQAVERWQTGYLPVYLVWLGFVALGFPPLFAFG
jgi:hypothetical protein